MKADQDKINIADLPPRKLDRFRTETLEEERARLERMAATDPGRYQRITATSTEFFNAFQSNNVHDARRIALTASKDEFIQDICFRAFFQAVQSVNVELVQLLVDELGLPYHQHPNSQFCAHSMIQNLDVADFRNGVGIIRALYRGPHALPVDAPRPMDGWSALCVAASRGLGSISWELMHAGANPNFSTPTGTFFKFLQVYFSIICLFVFVINS